MSLGESQNGLPPDSLVEGEAAIFDDSRRVIETYHDASHGSMTQIVLAPCSPFSVTPELLRETAELARAYGVRLHTHLCETFDEERYTLTHFQQRPVAWMETMGWLGDDVWFAHAVHVERRRDPRVRQDRCWGRALPLLEHEARLRYRTGQEVPRGRCARRVGRRWVRQQRCVEHPARGASGDAAGPAPHRFAPARGPADPALDLGSTTQQRVDDGAGGARDRDPRRRGPSWAARTSARWPLGCAPISSASI
jgi:hypothetical protein